jgi:hypothetical protein
MTSGDDQPPGDDQSSGDPGDPVGSVAVEAAKLLQALQDWAKDSGSEYAGATASAAAGAAATLRDLDEHIATGGEDCTYCPVCRLIHVVRGTSPEVREHLRTAATSLMEAAAGVLATPVRRPDHPPRNGSVQKIDLSDDEWEDD